MITTGTVGISNEYEIVGVGLISDFKWRDTETGDEYNWTADANPIRCDGGGHFGKGYKEGCVLPKAVGTYHIPTYHAGTPFPQYARHIRYALASGLPARLTRATKDVGNANRAAACPRGPVSCDEYPFASTTQGADSGTGPARSFNWCNMNDPHRTGPGSFSRCAIPLEENSAGGAHLNTKGYYPQRILPGDSFDVSVDPSEIDLRYQEMGAGSSFLGQPTTQEHCGLRDNGCFKQFQHGSLYYSPDSGVHSIGGTIREKWGELGWEGGTLGYPVTDEACGLQEQGCFQHFQRGSIYYSPGTGAHAIWGEIRTKWASLGWERSPLGFPTEEERCGLRDGGCVQGFQHGLLYFSASAGAHPVWGAILEKYERFGWERDIGYPTSDEFCGLRDGGCGQHFSQAASIYWAPRVGGAFVVRGAIRDRWSARGWENSTYGYPRSDETPRVDGPTGERYVTGWFERGAIHFRFRTSEIIEAP
ncbi:hypothetical protein GCM10027418_01850 [Mariniluteicoccus endophyticus]